MNNQPRLLSKPIPQKWPGMPVSEWLSDWHKLDRSTKDAQISRLLKLASSYDPRSEKMALDCAASARARIRDHPSQETRTNYLGGSCKGDWVSGPQGSEGGWTILGDGLRYDDIPLTASNDLNFITENPRFPGPPPAYYSGFESAWRQGSLATAQSVIASEVITTTPAFLHHGLCLALKADNVGVARYFLATGAPIVRKTPNHILSAPVDQQIPLFELLVDYGWTPNTPGI